MSLTKHCAGCGKNLGKNWFYVDYDGVWSDKCKFCSPLKPNPSIGRTAYNSWTSEQLITECKKRGLL